MQKGGASDGSDLPVAEKAAHRHVAEVFVEDAGVEVGTPVESFSAPEADSYAQPAQGPCQPLLVNSAASFPTCFPPRVNDWLHDAISPSSRQPRGLFTRVPRRMKFSEVRAEHRSNTKIALLDNCA